MRSGTCPDWFRKSGGGFVFAGEEKVGQKTGEVYA